MALNLKRNYFSLFILITLLAASVLAKPASSNADDETKLHKNSVSKSHTTSSDQQPDGKSGKSKNDDSIDADAEMDLKSKKKMKDELETLHSEKSKKGSSDIHDKPAKSTKNEEDSLDEIISEKKKDSIKTSKDKDSEKEDYLEHSSTSENNKSSNKGRGWDEGTVLGSDSNNQEITTAKNSKSKSKTEDESEPLPHPAGQHLDLQTSTEKYGDRKRPSKTNTEHTPGNSGAASKVGRVFCASLLLVSVTAILL